MNKRKNNKRFFISLKVFVLFLFSFILVSSAYGWGYKISNSALDVYNFLNTLGVYTNPIPIQEARLSCVRDGSQDKFTVFFKRGPSSGSWGYKKAFSLSDVVNFLNKVPPYSNIIKRAEIAAVWTGYRVEYHIFYQIGNTMGKPWKWKVTTSAEALRDFLTDAASNARVAAANINGRLSFYAFYQEDSTTGSRYHWILCPGYDPQMAGMDLFYSEHEVADVCSPDELWREKFYVFIRSDD